MYSDKYQLIIPLLLLFDNEINFVVADWHVKMGALKNKDLGVPL
jgi:hypothetical protein